jgi:4-alpha-glucanotransferase
MVLEYLGCREDDIVEHFIRLAYATTAKLCIIPLQDVFELNSSHRMNTPGTTAGNWKWRATIDMFGAHGLDKIDIVKDFGRIYGRSAINPQK